MYKNIVFIPTDAIGVALSSEHSDQRKKIGKEDIVRALEVFTLSIC